MNQRPAYDVSERPWPRIRPLTRRERAGVRGGTRLRRPGRGLAAPLLVLLAAFSTACLTFRRPEVAFRGVAVTSLGSDGVDLQADLDVFNPNSYKIGVEKLTYRLTVNGAEAGGGEAEEATSLPGKATTTVHLPLRLDWTKVKSTGLDFLTRGVDYTVEGEITFTTPVGKFHRPYRHAGSYSALGSR